MPRKFGNLYENLSATNNINVHLDEVHDIATITSTFPCTA